MVYERGIFLFHRDLRVEDNIGLHEALQQCNTVFTVFILTPDQVGNQNQYKSDVAVQFMLESLVDLASSLSHSGGRLLTFYGNTTAVVAQLVRDLSADVLIYNSDYSPYAVKRDQELRDRCETMHIDCLEFQDYLLFPAESSPKKKPYQKFTPFYDNFITMAVDKPLGGITAAQSRKLTASSSSATKISSFLSLRDAIARLNPHPNKDVLVRGGRSEAIEHFRRALREQVKYGEKRDFLTYKTTFLSAYIKFGCLSIREVYYGIKNRYGLRSDLLREVMWHEFFAKVLRGFPEVLHGSFQEKYRGLRWRTSKADFDKWCTGNTGFPLVDACMRQLNTVGYMHNRGRMVVATFLTKTLFLNWRLGERYFAQKLVDYDPASNNGNWQSISSTGVDGKPYFRDMNPWIQSRNFDRDAEYIKHWVPELREVEPEDIHRWDTEYAKYKGIKYPRPMVDYSKQKEKLAAFFSG